MNGRIMLVAALYSEVWHSFLSTFTAQNYSTLFMHLTITVLSLRLSFIALLVNVQYHNMKLSIILALYYKAELVLISFKMKGLILSNQ